MKKFVSFILAVCLMFSLTSIVGATNDNGDNVFYYDGKEITVEGDDLSYAEMQRIADYIAKDSESENAHTYGLICSIFGHNITESTAIEVTHNVYTASPKCVQKKYAVKICSRCDYTEKTLVSTTRIDCH